MSDETVNDATNNPAGSTAASGATAERVGFCQDCGTPLTKETLRNVGPGIFCEPCLNARVATPAAGYPVPPVAGLPNPWLAGFLGVIFPGAGACYNGQYAKGLVHLIVFAVLVSFANHVNGIFGLFVAGWVLYQGFEAFHTAKSRLMGAPLPNPFGLNEVGERIFSKGWTYTGSGWVQTPGAAPTGATVPPAGPGYVPPAYSGSDWVGYVPPTNFGGGPVPPPPAAQAAAPWDSVPYAQTYAPSAAEMPASAYVPPVVPVMPTRRFPAGAVVLVGLGVLFLLAEFAPEWGWNWNLSGRWLLPLLFAGLAIWIGTRRAAVGVRTIRAFRAPVVLMTLAVLFALQAGDIAGLHRTWPVFLIVLGGVLLAERTALNAMAFATTAPVGGSFVPMESHEEAAARTRAAWTSSEAGPTTGLEKSHTDAGEIDSTKGGY